MLGSNPSVSADLKLLSEAGDEKTHLPILDSNPRLGVYCDVRKRTSPSDDPHIPAPTENGSHHRSTEFGSYTGPLRPTLRGKP